MWECHYLLYTHELTVERKGDLVKLNEDSDSWQKTYHIIGWIYGLFDDLICLSFLFQTIFSWWKNTMQQKVGNVWFCFCQSWLVMCHPSSVFSYLFTYSFWVDFLHHDMPLTKLHIFLTILGLIIF